MFSLDQISPDYNFNGHRILPSSTLALGLGPLGFVHMKPLLTQDSHGVLPSQRSFIAVHYGDDQPISKPRKVDLGASEGLSRLTD